MSFIGTCTLYWYIKSREKEITHGSPTMIFTMLYPENNLLKQQMQRNEIHDFIFPFIVYQLESIVGANREEGEIWSAPTVLGDLKLHVMILYWRLAVRRCFRCNVFSARIFKPSPVKLSNFDFKYLILKSCRCERYTNSNIWLKFLYMTKNYCKSVTCKNFDMIKGRAQQQNIWSASAKCLNIG